MDGIIPRRDGQVSAFHIEQLFRIDGIVHQRLDVQRQLPDGQAGVPVVQRGAGFDAVLAQRVHGQRTAAAEDDLRAVLALDHGLFGVLVVGGIVRVVGLAVGQGIFRPVRHRDGHPGGFAADHGGGVGAGQGQAVQQQHDALRLGFHLHRAVRTIAGEGIDARAAHREGGSLHGKARRVLRADRDAAVRKFHRHHFIRRVGEAPRRKAVRSCLSRAAARRQTARKGQRAQRLQKASPGNFRALYQIGLHNQASLKKCDVI